MSNKTMVTEQPVSALKKTVAFKGVVYPETKYLGDSNPQDQHLW